jgi:hypothetical protein
MARVRRRRAFCWYLLLIVAGLALTVARPLDAASFSLAATERDEAIRLGRRSVVTEDFGAEWRVGGEAPGESLTVMTPFHRLALAARNSAFKSQDLKPRDVDSLLKDQEGKLVLWATLRGPKADFARFYAPALVRGQQEIKATFTQNERTALREEDGTYTARCMYVFPSDGLDPKGKVTLVVKDPDAKPVARFTVDLAAMR